MTPVQKMPKDDFKKQIDIVYSLLSMLNSDASTSPNTFRLLGGNNPETVGKVKVNGKVLEAVMRLTFEEKYRKSICDLEGLQAISAILVDCTNKLDAKPTSDNIIKKLKHTCMALTNLTYGDIHNKKIVCSIEGFVPSLVKLLDKSGEDLRKVVAGVIRNISWKADSTSKMVLRESGVVFGLLKCSMETERESTLKCLLNALWNISSHSAENKADICDYPHSLEFIVSLLSQSETIVENGGGILKNISSHIAVNDHCRQVLRKHHCLELLLSHLQSTNTVVVANACGTLWNLSARCAEDQQSLWKLGAVGLLGNLVNSEDKAISLGSSAALKNLLLFKTNSSSLFSSCSSSPSDDKNKESAYYIDRKKEKEASADSSTAHTFQPVSINKSYNENSFKANNIQNSVFHKSIHQANASHLFQSVPQSNYDYESDMKPNLYYGFDESTDEIIDFSNKYKENCFGSSTDQLLDSTKPLYSPSDHPKHYCTEDTPETYSEINAPACNLNTIETPFIVTSTSQSDIKMYDKPNKAILVNYKSSGSSENSSNPNSGHKSVTFSEINQTPMMFSRTTSLDSVNSFEATSVHSSVGSIYSHRPSGVVSPSELPDSPGETMPPSPHTGKEEVKKNVVNNHIPSLNDNNDDNANGDEVNDYDFSDNENENEELLEEVIEAAMPNGLKQKREIKKFATDDMKSYYAEDTIKCYMSEGTPLIFSRNDSLSSLGSKTSPQRPNNHALSALHPKVKNFIFNHDQLARSNNKKANLTSTPSVKAIPILEDQVLKYEVEGTPDKVPPLSFDEEEDRYRPSVKFNNISNNNKNREQNQPNQISCTQQSNQSFNQTIPPQHNKATTSIDHKSPQGAQHSETHDDSDSSVSFESSDVDTSPLDNRLLQECIVSGLPKNKKRKHRKFLFDYDQLHKNDSLNESSRHHKDGNKSNEVSRGMYLDEDEYIFSGPSTEANNTVIYRGVLLNEEEHEEEEHEKNELVMKKDDLNAEKDELIHEKGELIDEKIESINENDELINEMHVKDELTHKSDEKITSDSVKNENKDIDSFEDHKEMYGEDQKTESTTEHLSESDVCKDETDQVEEGVHEGSENNALITSEEQDPDKNVGLSTLGGWQEDGPSQEYAAVGAQLEITSTASEGNYDASDSTDCDKQREFLTLVSDFYNKTSIKEREENIFQFKPRSPITSSVSDGNIKASKKPTVAIKNKKHSKSKVFDFIKKSLKKKKKNSS